MLGFSFFPYKRVLDLFSFLLTTIALLLSASVIRSQDQKEKKSNDADEIIKVSSNLVSLDVIVKYKKVRAVTDLKAEDFTISENGVKQTVAFFDSTLSGGDASQPAAPAAVATESGTQPRPGLPR